MNAPEFDIDFRAPEEIRSGPHAVAELGGYTRVVRGIDRFTHLPTRERAAVVWVASKFGMGSHHTEVVALDDITLHPGSDS